MGHSFPFLILNFHKVFIVLAMLLSPFTGQGTKERGMLCQERLSLSRADVQGLPPSARAVIVFQR
jgi:hypothetical protein